jgi:hypothetical protein
LSIWSVFVHVDDLFLILFHQTDQTPKIVVFVVSKQARIKK